MQVSVWGHCHYPGLISLCLVLKTLNPLHNRWCCQERRWNVSRVNDFNVVLQGGFRKLPGERRMRSAQLWEGRDPVCQGALGSFLPPGCPRGMKLVSWFVALATGVGSWVLCEYFSDSSDISDLCRQCLS